MNTVKPQKIILLCNYSHNSADTILAHINAFKNYPNADVSIVNLFGDIPDNVDINLYDLLIIHYTLCIGRSSYLSLKAKFLIRQFKGLKALIIQDDYRWIYSTISNCIYMGLNVIFGLADQSIVPILYPKKFLPNVRIKTVLTGYVDDYLLSQTSVPYDQRKVDVSYRARKVPFWLGAHTLQKWQIAEKFLESTKIFNLHCDISTREEDRLYGKDWENLLKNSKAVLGTESGVSLCDFTGELQQKVENYCLQNPEITFEEVENLFFPGKDYEIMMNVISPRIFEAIAFNVLLILYPGEYSGILKPWRHYVPLNPDHSNIEEVVEILRCPERSQEIVQRARDEILWNSNLHYSSFTQQLSSVLNEVSFGIEKKKSNGFYFITRNNKKFKCLLFKFLQIGSSTKLEFFKMPSLKLKSKLREIFLLSMFKYYYFNKKLIKFLFLKFLLTASAAKFKFFKMPSRKLKSKLRENAMIYTFFCIIQNNKLIKFIQARRIATKFEFLKIPLWMYYKTRSFYYNYWTKENNFFISSIYSYINEDFMRASLVAVVNDTGLNSVQINLRLQIEEEKYLLSRQTKALLKSLKTKNSVCFDLSPLCKAFIDSDEKLICPNTITLGRKKILKMLKKNRYIKMNVFCKSQPRLNQVF